MHTMGFVGIDEWMLLVDLYDIYTFAIIPISNLNLCHYFTNHKKINQPGFPKLYFRFKNIGLDGINQTPNIVNNLWCCWVFSISLFFSLKKHDLVFLVLNFYNFTLLKAQKRSVCTCVRMSAQASTHTHTHTPSPCSVMV